MRAVPALLAAHPLGFIRTLRKYVTTAVLIAVMWRPLGRAR